MNDKKYIILNTSELDKAIVSYEGSMPSALSGKTEYTNAQINTIINSTSNGWYEEEE